MKPLRYTPLVFKQLLRNKRRSILTFLGLVVAFFLFASLESVLFTLQKLLTRSASETTVFVRPKYGVPFWLAEIPQSYLPRIASIDGVVAATPYQFFVGEGAHEGDFNVAVGADSESIRKVRNVAGVGDQTWELFRRERTAAIVGERMAELNGWEVGDEVTIRGVGATPKNLTFRIRGLTSAGGDFNNVAIVHLDYLQETVGVEGRLTFIVMRVENQSVVPSVIFEIQEKFRNLTVPLEALSEKSFIDTVLGGLSDALIALSFIGYLTLAATVLVVANTVAMGIRERTTEIGTMRALGFSATSVLALVLSEALLLSLLGALAGSGTAYGLIVSGAVELPKEAGFALSSDAMILLKSALLSLPVGLLAGLQPAIHIARMPITDALRYAE